jgi:hypothetical protein
MLFINCNGKFSDIKELNKVMGLSVQYVVILTKAKSGKHNARQLKQESLDKDSNNSRRYICLSTALNETKDY